MDHGQPRRRRAGERNYGQPVHRPEQRQGLAVAGAIDRRWAQYGQPLGRDDLPNGRFAGGLARGVGRKLRFPGREAGDQDEMGCAGVSGGGLSHAARAVDIDRQEAGGGARLYQPGDVDDQVGPVSQAIQGFGVRQPAGDHLGRRWAIHVRPRQDAEHPASGGQRLAHRPAQEAGGAGQGGDAPRHVRR